MTRYRIEQTTLHVLDTADPPGALAIYAAGYAGAVRFIGEPGHAHCVTRQELDDATDYGVGIALLHARPGHDWHGGYPAGHAAATVARSHASAVGFPDSRPIYFAVTPPASAAQFATARDYLTGVADALGVEHTGVYGNRDVVTMARGTGVASYFWQHRDSPGVNTDVNLDQLANTVTVGGVHCGVSTAHAADWGQHLNAGQGDAPLMVGALVAASEHLSDEAVLKLATAYASELARRRQARQSN